jgi:hypothetical protein
VSLALADKIFLVIGVIDVVGIFICLGVALHMAYTRTYRLLDYFTNSPAVITLSPLRHGGPWGRLLMIGAISSYVTFSKNYIKRGSLGEVDFINLPGPIKLKLIMLQWSVIVFLLIMICMWLAGEFGLV